MTIRTIIPPELLKSIKVFEGMDDAGYEHLSRITLRRPYKSGKVIILEGDDPLEIYFVLRGWVKVLLGKSEDILLGPGEMFGEAALMENGKFLPPDWRTKKRNATVLAQTEVDLLYVYVDPLDTLLESYPTIMERFDKLARERTGTQASSSD